MFMLRSGSVPAMILACLLLAGCGGSGQEAQFRLLNVSADYTSIDLYAGSDQADATEVITGVAKGTLSSYYSEGAGTYDLYFTSHGVSKSNALTSLNETLSKGTHRTYVTYGDTGGFGLMEIGEDQSVPSSGYADVEVLDTATDAGSLDVYLTSQGVSLNDVTANFGGLSVGKETSFSSIADGTYELRITGSGNRSDIRLDVSGIALSSLETLSIIITESPGGYLVGALILPQQGSLTTESNSNARVRAAIGLSSGSNVSAVFGSTSLLSAAPATAIGAYQLVPSGSQTVTLTVNGTAVSVPSQTLTPGQDYTFLVWTDSSSNVADALITDNNRLPQSGDASVRLVNLMSGYPDPISLSIDSVPIATGITLGTASAYGSPTATTTATLSLLDATTSQLITSQNDVTLSADVYSVFVFGSTAGTASMQARQDR